MKSISRIVAIVEDDGLVGQATANLVRSLGLGVQVFRTVDALLAEPSRDFGCVISDVQMPGRSGLELLDILRSGDDCTPVIMMTAYPTAQVTQRALDAGAHCVLEKPYDPEFLVECLAFVFGSFDD